MATQRKVVHQGRVVDLGIETFDAPNGVRMELEIVRHPGGAAAVAVNDAAEVCLLRQYRHAAGGWIVELPAGKIDHGEDPAQTARRELKEEAGISAARWTSLDSMYSTPGFCDEAIYLYLAEGLTIGPSHLEHGEFIEVFWQPLSEACKAAVGGTIRDAKTVIGLLRASATIASQ